MEDVDRLQLRVKIQCYFKSYSTATFYQITKKLLVQMYLLVYYLCTKIKRKRSLHSRETNMDTIKNKMATRWPILFESQEKMTHTCPPVCMITMPTLIQIGPVISEEQLRTREK